MSTIHVANLTKTYSSFKKQAGFKGALKSLFKREKINVEAVKAVSFDIAEGELVGFLGPNGAGKTTTLKMLSGILYPSGGVATVLGYTPWERQRAYQKQFAIVMGQKNQLWWDLPAQDTFLLNKEIYEIPQQKYERRVAEMAELLNVKDLLEVPVRKLSLGERMKMELIAALLHEPKILYLDEPTIGLDVVSQQKIREFIREYNERTKTTIILTSHYMEDVEALCKRVIIIDHGQIIFDGALQSLIDEHAKHKILTITFTAPVFKKDLEKYGLIREHDKMRVVLEVPDKDVKKSAAAILTKLPVDDILIGEVPIEDIIREIFQKKVQA